MRFEPGHKLSSIQSLEAMRSCSRKKLPEGIQGRGIRRGYRRRIGACRDSDYEESRSSRLGNTIPLWTCTVAIRSAVTPHKLTTRMSYCNGHAMRSYSSVCTFQNKNHSMKKGKIGKLFRVPIGVCYRFKKCAYAGRRARNTDREGKKPSL